MRCQEEGLPSRQYKVRIRSDEDAFLLGLDEVKGSAFEDGLELE